jgi:hypothetical protein
MKFETKPAAFAAVAERLGKLIPRLASDHDGEVTATVAAISRTLSGAGLDWHDLARRVAEPGFDDLVTAAPWAPKASNAPSWTSPAPAPTPPKAKRHPGPAPWPSVSTLSREGLLAWIEAIDASPYSMERGTRAVFDAWHQAIRVGGQPDRDGRSVINRLIRTCWQRGWRPEEMAA